MFRVPRLRSLEGGLSAEKQEHGKVLLERIV
jgi:hypothetical protein